MEERCVNTTLNRLWPENKNNMLIQTRKVIRLSTLVDNYDRLTHNFSENENLINNIDTSLYDFYYNFTQFGNMINKKKHCHFSSKDQRMKIL